MYYNREEQLMIESVPVIIRGPRKEEYSIIPDPKTKYEARLEMQEYYGKRRFILASLNSREEDIFSMYYGLYDGKFKTQREISEKYDLSDTRVSQILLKIHRKLRQPNRIRPCLYLTDEQVGYSESTRYKFYDLKEVAVLKDEKVAQIKMDRLNNIPKDQKIADNALNIILSSNVTKELNKDEIESLRKYGYSIYSYEYILSIDIDKLKNNDLEFLIDKIHSIGLIFKCEAEYQEDWETICRLGIMRVGVDNLMKRFNTESSQTDISKEVNMNRNLNTFNNLLETTLEEWNLSVRAYNCLKRAGIDTIEDVVQRSELELISIRNLGKRSFNEIMSKLYSLGLDLCPEDFGPKEWLLILKKRFNVQTTSEKEINMDINEIPEKYRRTYAIGAGVEASQKIEYTDRLFTRAIANRQLYTILTNIQSLPAIKISRRLTIEEEMEKIDKKMNNQYILRHVKENILSTYDLEMDYIAQHKDELIDFVLNNHNVGSNKKIELIKFIRDAKKDNYTL